MRPRRGARTNPTIYRLSAAPASWAVAPPALQSGSYDPGRATGSGLTSAPPSQPNAGVAGACPTSPSWPLAEVQAAARPLRTLLALSRSDPRALRRMPPRVPIARAAAAGSAACRGSVAIAAAPASCRARPLCAAPQPKSSTPAGQHPSFRAALRSLASTGQPRG
eukprot:scaffold567_cov384-Prasinococcus_capsulatus_cf.AAC.13